MCIALCGYQYVFKLACQTTDAKMKIFSFDRGFHWVEMQQWQSFCTVIDLSSCELRSFPRNLFSITIFKPITFSSHHLISHTSIQMCNTCMLRRYYDSDSVFIMLLKSPFLFALQWFTSQRFVLLLYCILCLPTTIRNSRLTAGFLS